MAGKQPTERRLVWWMDCNYMTPVVRSGGGRTDVWPTASCPPTNPTGENKKRISYPPGSRTSGKAKSMAWCVSYAGGNARRFGCACSRALHMFDSVQQHRFRATWTDRSPRPHLKVHGQITDGTAFYLLRRAITYSPFHDLLSCWPCKLTTSLCVYVCGVYIYPRSLPKHTHTHKTPNPLLQVHTSQGPSTPTPHAPRLPPRPPARSARKRTYACPVVGYLTARRQAGMRLG